MKTKILYDNRTSALSRLNRLLGSKAYEGARFFIVVDENTYEHCLPLLITHVKALEEAEFFEVAAGEECKSIEVAAQLWGALLDAGADRNSVIINLGGGSICDLGGFVAAGYKRGIRHVNIPTTLLAMVDAAIGGKTAVDLEGVKNPVGFVHQPEAVCIHLPFLATLEEAQYTDGLFEMAKTLMLSAPYNLENFYSANGRDSQEPFVRDCAEFKAAVAKADPAERSTRKILNLGHTFGHGIESYFSEIHRPISHGRAVALGLWCALYLSVQKLGLDAGVLKRYREWMRQRMVIPRMTLKDTEGILRYMRQDKKNAEGLIMSVLLQAPGVPVIDVALNENEVRDALLKMNH